MLIWEKLLWTLEALWQLQHIWNFISSKPALKTDWWVKKNRNIYETYECICEINSIPPWFLLLPEISSSLNIQQCLIFHISWNQFSKILYVFLFYSFRIICNHVKMNIQACIWLIHDKLFAQFTIKAFQVIFAIIKLAIALWLLLSVSCHCVVRFF
jgi:hypothetical protein